MASRAPFEASGITVTAAINNEDTSYTLTFSIEDITSDGGEETGVQFYSPGSDGWFDAFATVPGPAANQITFYETNGDTDCTLWKFVSTTLTTFTPSSPYTPLNTPSAITP